VAAAALDKTALSGVRASRNAVIKDAETFSAMWAQHAMRDADGNIRPLPQVDFSKQMVIGVFGGQLPNGCYSTGIAGIVTDGATISVRRTDTVPDKNAVCATNQPSPAQLVAVERSNLPVEFFTEQVMLRPGQ
jgi:hypothetical protein